jgi:DNA-binding transcriptional LysR family regulator
MPSPAPPALPPLYNLQAFLVAAEAGSFTRAAPLLHLTQGAVSRQVLQLEAHFGRPLFVRQARGLALTTDGAVLLAAVREAFAGLARASQTIQRTGGAITLQVPPTLAARWLLPRLPRLREALPGLDLRLATNWHDDPDFSHADVDAVIAYGNGRWPGVTAVRLMRENLAPVCAPALARRLKTQADLARAELLHPGPLRREWKRWLEAARATGVSHERGAVFDTLDLALGAAARGQGVAIADPAMLGEALAGGVLVMPFRQVTPSGRAYYLTHPAQREPAAQLLALQGWLLDEFGKSAD